MTETATIEFSLPGNTDTARLVFGGPGLDPSDMPATATGLFLTYILDYALPMILRQAGAGTEKSEWFAALLADQDLVDDILAQGTFLLTQPKASLPDLLRQITQRVPSLFADSRLAFLRQRINKEIGPKSVENAVPFLGWPAQILAHVLEAMPGEPEVETANTEMMPSRLTAVPSAIHLPCFPGMAGMLEVDILPDPAYGLWPPATDLCQVTVRYDHGFSRQWEGKPTPRIAFGSIPTPAPIYIRAELRDSKARVCATGGKVVPEPASVLKSGIIAADVVLTTHAQTITPDTVYRLDCRLRYDTEKQAYAWSSGMKNGGRGDAAPGRVPGLVGITSRASDLSIGYTWRASGLGLPDCRTWHSLDTGYLFRNIGTADPENRLKTIDCCFNLMAHLVYAPYGPGENTYYFDPRNGANLLCPVDLSQTGTFDLKGEKGVGRFRENILDAMAVASGGHAAAVAAASGTLEIIKLADTLQATPPLSMAFRGEGTPEGPLQWPVGVDFTPDTALLVLERHPIRVRCFDIYGNPVPRFNGSACFIPVDNGADGLDICVSPSGLIYILFCKNGGKTTADYNLAVFSCEGKLICSTPGVEAARISVTGDGRVYTLDPFCITGPMDRPEPGVSQWIPGCAQ